LERRALPGWLALHEPLGEWTLRAAGGFTGRANSCLAVGDPGARSSRPRASSVRRRQRHRCDGSGGYRLGRDALRPWAGSRVRVRPCTR
jgi:hypothetical protein